MTVAELLKASWAAHMDRKRTGIEEAYRLRVEAHELDPEHTDRAWQDEQRLTPRTVDTHAALMAFYENETARNNG